MIQVFHKDERYANFTADGGKFWPGSFDKVATVDLPDDNYAKVFELTNTIEHGWWENKGVEAHFDSPAFFEVEEHPGVKGTRSTSVGDVIVLSDGRVLECASVGWAEISGNGGCSMSKLHPTITSADVRQSHTPGPWTEDACEVQAADGSAICEMLARPEDKEKWGRHHADANSRLICAAPDLLAELIEVVQWYEACLGEDPSFPQEAEVFKRAREAIAKAGGAA